MYNSAGTVGFVSSVANGEDPIRVLSAEEIDEVNGGFLPVIGFGIALASHVGVGGAASSAVGHVLSGVGLGLATYGLANYWGGGGGGGRGSSKTVSH